MSINTKDLNAASHMLAHCERIERYLERCDRSLEEFMNDELVQDGVTMQLLAMGELPTVKRFFAGIVENADG
ncbi:MAG: hypothetical protein LUC38_08195 [Oscillospiraceae bacterium]|nr:hypothetical protein [Ruminococcus sp.]MCD8345914.1 hypothetical protein [Oscillospiraceae bacterium]